MLSVFVVLSDFVSIFEDSVPCSPGSVSFFSGGSGSISSVFWGQIILKSPNLLSVAYSLNAFGLFTIARQYLLFSSP